MRQETYERSRADHGTQNMRYLIAVATFASLFPASLAQAEWKTLRNADGRIVEVAVDLQIESVHITPKGDVSMIAKTMEQNQEIGFSLSITNLHSVEAPTIGRDQPAPMKRCDIEIRSIGKATTRLADMVRSQLGESPMVHFGSPMAITAPYIGYVLSDSSTISMPSIFSGTSPGIAYDENGDVVGCDSYHIRLIVDGPMRSLRIYLSLEGGFGGMAPGDRARSQWYKSTQTQVARETEDSKSLPAAPDTSRDGTTFETAVLIDVKHQSESAAAEWAWIEQHLPGARAARNQSSTSKDIDEETVSFAHHLIVRKGRIYSAITVEMPDGKEQTVYFDITQCFGK